MLGFRVWDSKDKCFYIDPSDDGLYSSSEGNLIAISATSYNIYSFIADQRFIPMQSTGLQDSDGNVIFQGDVVNFYKSDCGYKEYDELYLIDGFYEFFAYHRTMQSCGCQTFIRGNIYENSELLEKIK